MRKLLTAAALILAAGAVGWFLARSSEHAVSLGEPPRPVAASQAAQRTGVFSSDSSFSVWLVRDGRLVETLRTHRPTRRLATAALEALLAGPTQSERASSLATAIPAGTRLLGVTIADGVARVDLTSDFESAATSREIQLRLEQVVYTATQFPTVRRVRFLVGGAPTALAVPIGRGAYSAVAPLASPLAGTWRRLPPAAFGSLSSRASAWTGKELLLLGRTAAGRTVFASFTPGLGWRQLAPPRGLGSLFRVAWTGRELIAWGSTVTAYSPATRRWRGFPSPPAGGSPKLMVWTGRELIGWTSQGGAAYRLHKGWRGLPKAPLVSAPVWTGKELIVIGGPDAAASFTPGRGWRRLPPPPLPQVGASEVWDGNEVLLVGGPDAPGVGLAYSPATNRWRELAPMNPGRQNAAAVWTGNRLILWGGEAPAPGGPVIPPHGLAYDPKADRWSPLPQAPLRGRRDPVGVWTGRSFIVWGGDPGFADGASFTPRVG